MPPVVVNLLSNLPAKLDSESFETLVTGQGCRLQRIVSSGQRTADGDWYDQQEAEWVMVLKGAAKLRFEGQDQLLAMGPGDAINIAAHQRHRVEWTSPHEPTVWLAVHYDP